MPAARMKIDQEYEVVPIGSIQEHPDNPRRGVVEAIDESIEHNGWYGACVVQRSTKYILVGNHRHRTAKARGATRIPVIWKDVDDETAMRIMLADNKTADLGTYDEETLDRVLSGLETLDGTAYGLAAVIAAEESGEGEEGAEEVPDDVYSPTFGVIVVCEDEERQRAVFEALTELSGSGEFQDVELRVVAV